VIEERLVVADGDPEVGDLTPGGRIPGGFGGGGPDTNGILGNALIFNEHPGAGRIGRIEMGLREHPHVMEFEHAKRM
jgi:hypothetical protein